MAKAIHGIRTGSLSIPLIAFITGISMPGNAPGQDIRDIGLRDYNPVPIYNIPVTIVQKARYPVIDMHTHACRNEEDVARCVRVMDECGVEKAIVFARSGERFDAAVEMYSKYPGRFELWCGFDYTGYDQPGYGPDAVRELERCVEKGARGVGEIMFKGKGISPGARDTVIKLPDDPRLAPLFNRCAELGLPVNLHVSEDKLMYEPMDETNDGLPNAARWEVRMENGAKTHEEMLVRLENTLKKYPNTTFIAAHFANCCADLSYLGRLFDTYPNLYADISARLGEIASVPRYAHDFIEKYADRLVYAADMTIYDPVIYRGNWRILETSDEHFYELHWNPYHWPLYGLYLSDNTLRKLYRETALKLLDH
jgi:predicted TIM-barrel fold metal-dependent hydrolase